MKIFSACHNLSTQSLIEIRDRIEGILESRSQDAMKESIGLVNTEKKNCIVLSKWLNIIKELVW